MIVLRYMSPRLCLSLIFSHPTSILLYFTTPLSPLTLHLFLPLPYSPSFPPQSLPTSPPGTCSVGYTGIMSKSQTEKARSRALSKLYEIYPLTGTYVTQWVYGHG